jgi:hypothetical protein
MVPRRQQIPTPGWAELPPRESTSAETFQPFSTGASLSPIVAPVGGAACCLLTELPPAAGDEGGDVPQLSLF